MPQCRSRCSAHVEQHPGPRCLHVIFSHHWQHFEHLKGHVFGKKMYSPLWEEDRKETKGNISHNISSLDLIAASRACSQLHEATKQTGFQVCQIVMTAILKCVMQWWYCCLCKPNFWQATGILVKMVSPACSDGCAWAQPCLACRGSWSRFNQD